jgi:hypothetical protein
MCSVLALLLLLLLASSAELQLLLWPLPRRDVQRIAASSASSA